MTKAPSKDETSLMNVLKLLQKGKYELTGEEALAFRQSFEYLVNLLRTEQAKNSLPVVAETINSPIKEEVKSKKKK